MISPYQSGFVTFYVHAESETKTASKSALNLEEVTKCMEDSDYTEETRENTCKVTSTKEVLIIERIQTFDFFNLEVSQVWCVIAWWWRNRHRHIFLRVCE